MNSKSFLILLVFLSASLSGCQSWEPRNYKFAFKYHPKVGGGTSFGVLDHKFVELTDSQISDLLKTSVIMPASTWEMIAVDLVKACRMLGKKCKQEVDTFTSVFDAIKKENKKIDERF